ncbi:sensor histidine kinase [Streptomyces sp. SAI-229]|uniref:sensor histidine kinase n=1 Tax=Streptomyces sp. SAI-229 TaxID=3377731 RepID=UPI003C7DAA94
MAQILSFRAVVRSLAQRVTRWPSWRSVTIVEGLLVLVGALVCATAALRIAQTQTWAGGLASPVLVTLGTLAVGVGAGLLLLKHRRHPLPLALAGLGLCILYFGAPVLPPLHHTVIPESGLTWWAIKIMLWGGLYALALSGAWRALAPVTLSVALLDLIGAWHLFRDQGTGPFLAMLASNWTADVVVPVVLGWCVRHRRALPAALLVLGVYFLEYGIFFPFGKQFFAFPSPEATSWILTITLISGLYALAVSNASRPILIAVTFTATAVVVFTQWLTYGAESPDIFLRILTQGMAVHILMPIGLGLYVKTRRRLIAGLCEREKLLKRERHLLADQARAGERARIAHEMHDVVAHRVTDMIGQARALATRAVTDPRTAAEEAGHLGDVGRQALAQLREVLIVLRRSDAPESDTARPRLAGLVTRARQAAPSAAQAHAPEPRDPVDKTAPVWRRVLRQGPSAVEGLLVLVGALVCATAALRIAQTQTWAGGLASPVLVTLGTLAVGVGAGLLLLKHRRHPLPLALAGLGLCILYFGAPVLPPLHHTVIPESGLTWWAIKIMLWGGLYALALSGAWRALAPVTLSVALLDLIGAWHFYQDKGWGGFLSVLAVTWVIDVVTPVVLGWSVCHRRPLPPALLGLFAFHFWFNGFLPPLRGQFFFPDAALTWWAIVLPVTASLYVLALSSTSRRGLAVTTLTATSLWAINILHYDVAGNKFSILSGLVYNLIPFIVVPVGLGLYIKTRRQVVAGLREHAVRLEREQHLLAAKAQAEERARIAREMHDVVGHGITHMVMHANTAQVQAARSGQATAAAAELIGRLGQQTLAELRQVLGALQSDQPAELGAAQPRLEDLAPLVTQVRTTGAPVDLHVEGPARPASRIMEVAAYRIVQESLTNAHKHAGDAPAQVVVRYLSQAVEVVVENAAPGSRPASALPSGGLGLVSMRERAEVLGGQFHAGATEQGGFRVEARLPYAPAA